MAMNGHYNDPMGSKTIIPILIHSMPTNCLIHQGLAINISGYMVTIASGGGLASADAEPLPEPILSYRQ